MIGCAGLARPAPPPPRPAPAVHLLPWQVPPSAFGTQRLFRLSYSGPEGEGSLRVILRLAAEGRFEAQAVDPVGRSLWSLAADGDQGLWLDHRSHLFCHPEGRLQIPGLPIGSFPLAALPALLLGRLPAMPAPGTEPERAGDQITLHDDLGRRWTATLAGLTLRAWTLWEDDQAAVPLASWALLDSTAVLSVPARGDRARGRASQVRWKEVLVERLAAPLAPLVAPSGFRELPRCAPASGTPPPEPGGP